MIVNTNNYHIDHFTNSPLKKIDGNVKTQRMIHLILTVCGDRGQGGLYQTLIDGVFLEFGVYKGTSINLMANLFPEQEIHGFDSFEGLPEDWKYNHNQIFKKGHFKRDTPPKVKKNIKLWKGWFKDTIPQYKKSVKSDISFLHIDSDLYLSCIDILYGLNEYIVKDTIILFDEFYPWGEKPYDFWEEGEYKALGEWLNTFNREIEPLFHNNHQQCTVKVIK